MVHHPMLKYQIEKFLGENPDLAPMLHGFLQEIDRTYHKFESDRARIKHEFHAEDFENIIEDREPRLDREADADTSAGRWGGDEQFFRRIVEATTEPIAVFGPSGDLFLTNDAFDSMFALTDERSESNFLRFLTRDSSHAFTANITSALELGGTWEGLLEASYGEGNTFPLWFRGDAILDDTGSVLFIIGIMHDASGQDLVERTLTAYQTSGQQVDLHQGSYAALQQLADAIGKQSALLQCILDIAWLKDSDGKYQAVNKVFCRWFGVEEGAVIGKTDADFLPEYTTRMMATTDAEVIRQRRLLRKEVAVQGSDGQIYWCELVKVPSYAESGAVTGIAGIMRDISITKESTSRYTTRTAQPVADFMASGEFAHPKAASPQSSTTSASSSTTDSFVERSPSQQTPPPATEPQSLEQDAVIRGKHEFQQRDAIMAAINLAAEYFLRVPPWDKHIQEVLEWLGRATNVSRVYVFQNMREESGKVHARQCYEWSTPGMESNLHSELLQHFNYEEQGFHRWIDSMQSGDIILGNVKDFPEAERKHFAALQTTSLVAVPIFVDGAWWGYLGFDECVAERDWKPIIIDVLKTAANLIGAVIERERTEGSYRTMAEHSLQELMIAQNGRIVYANPEAIRNSGVSEHELYRFGSTDLYGNVIEEDAPIVAQALATLKSGSKESIRVEFRAKKKDGSTRWLEALLTLVNYKGNPAIQIVQVDSTGRKNAEAALQERSSLELFVGDVSSRFINLAYDRIDDAITGALAMLAEFYQAQYCFLYLGENNGHVGAMSHEWFAPGVLASERMQGRYNPDECHWLRSEIQATGSLLLNDVNALPAEARQERSLFTEWNFSSIAVVGVQVHGQTVGSITLGFTRKIAQWADEIVPGLSLVGDIMINALQRKQAEEALVMARERYSLATEAGNVGVWDWDITKDEIYIDATLKEMIGYSDSEIPNDIDAWIQHVHPEDFAEAVTRIADARIGRLESYSSEQRMIHRDGHVVWFLITGKVLRDENGAPLRIVGTDTNITELKNAERALRESELQSRTILNSLPDTVYVVNKEGLITAVMESEGLENNVQFRENPMDKNIFDLISRDSAERFMKLLRDVLARGTSDIIEYEFYDSIHENLHYFESRLARLNAEAVLVVTREITARKHSEQALIENNDILKVRNEELDAFSHTVAHDLKNPLTLVIGYAGLLNEAAADMKPSEVKQYLSNILLNSKRMNSIIESLLLLAEVRQEDVEIDELDMKFIVDESLSRLSYMISEYMAVVVLPDKWPAAKGYSSWVEEVWVNYITNAMKYGGRPPKIELGADRTIKGYIRYWVKDNGKGIAREDVDKLFSPLSRLGTGTIKGYGLGLSIVKRIIEKLHGKIGVESEVGKGSTFWFALPEHEDTK